MIRADPRQAPSSVRRTAAHSACHAARCCAGPSGKRRSATARSKKPRRGMAPARLITSAAIIGRSEPEPRLFAGSVRDGQRTAAMYTLVGTGKLNGIDPQAWLADVIVGISDMPVSRLTELLPWNCAAPEDAVKAACPRLTPDGCVRMPARPSTVPPRQGQVFRGDRAGRPYIWPRWGPRRASRQDPELFSAPQSRVSGEPGSAQVSSRSAKQSPRATRSASNGAGCQKSGSSAAHSSICANTHFRPSVSAQCIGPPRQRGKP